jgi:hypothetical protein
VYHGDPVRGGGPVPAYGDYDNDIVAQLHAAGVAPAPGSNRLT